MSYRSFMAFPDRRVEEVTDDGTIDHVSDPTLYDDLLTAGYPLHRDDNADQFDSIIDVRVEDDGRVLAHTTGAAPREHDMGPASVLFLAWFRGTEQS